MNLNRVASLSAFFLLLVASVASALAAIWLPSEQWAQTATLSGLLTMLAAVWSVIAHAP